MHWKNKSWLWSALVEKCSVTHRTHETYAAYMSFKKAEQDRIKNVGGFVGAYLAGGRRKNGSVTHRQLITLDIDNAHDQLWSNYTMLHGYAACVYSTHKHSAETPRLRMLIPLDRGVLADEYIAITRRVASWMGIDNFDPVSFRPTQLMYWPSTSKDGEFFFDYVDTEWLSADYVLNTYHDWTDSSEWPTCTREDKAVGLAMKKQGDPLEKPGIVGAFCRTYDIHQAIEKFLPEVYEACDVEDRYTYLQGSTSAGVVVYEDKFIYSHHGSDPTSNKLCNAFDMVRLHLFGLEDEGAAEDTPGNRLPSFIAMEALAMKDKQVRILLGSENLAKARADFESVEIEDGELDNDDEENEEWLADMEVDRKGNYLSTIENVVLILSNDTKLKGRLALNSFEKREVALKNLPWRKVTHATRHLTDTDDAALRHYLEKTYNIGSVSKIKDALDIVVMRNAFHPVRDYLDGLKWDGIKRAETLLIDYMGVDDNPYTRAITRKTLAAAVTRVYNPGCKFDYVLVLVGKQGQKKSSLFDRLGGPWFSDSFTTIQGREAYEQLQGAWIVEMGELAGLKKAEVETIKQFISKRVDRYRVAYGRRVEDFPRQCIIVATTNIPEFVRDHTGGRRFWPADTYETTPTKDVFKDLTDAEVGQIWAEAVTFYKAGEPLYLSKELEEMAQMVQSDHSEHDSRMGMVQKYLDTLLPENWPLLDIYERRSWLQGDPLQSAGNMQRAQVCVAEIWCELLGGQQREMNTFNTKDLHAIMTQMEGWTLAKSKLNFGAYGKQKAYLRLEPLKTKNAISGTTGKKSAEPLEPLRNH